MELINERKESNHSKILHLLQQIEKQVWTNEPTEQKQNYFHFGTLAKLDQNKKKASVLLHTEWLIPHVMWAWRGSCVHHASCLCLSADQKQTASKSTFKQKLELSSLNFAEIKLLYNQNGSSK